VVEIRNQFATRTSTSGAKRITDHCTESFIALHIRRVFQGRKLGWFMAKLGRSRVIVLCQGEIEILSDLGGLIYLPFKESILEVMPRLSKALRDAGMM
jgi:hypothetical protein